MTCPRDERVRRGRERDLVGKLHYPRRDHGGQNYCVGVLHLACHPRRVTEPSTIVYVTTSVYCHLRLFATLLCAVQPKLLLEFYCMLPSTLADWPASGNDMLREFLELPALLLRAPTDSDGTPMRPGK